MPKDFISNWRIRSHTSVQSCYRINKKYKCSLYSRKIDCACPKVWYFLYFLESIIPYLMRNFNTLVLVWLPDSKNSTFTLILFQYMCWLIIPHGGTLVLWQRVVVNWKIWNIDQWWSILETSFLRLIHQTSN